MIEVELFVVDSRNKVFLHVWLLEGSCLGVTSMGLLPHCLTRHALFCQQLYGAKVLHSSSSFHWLLKLAGQKTLRTP